MPGLRDRHSDKLQVCSPATGTRVGDRFRRSITVALSKPDLAWLCILIQFQPSPLSSFQNSPSLQPLRRFIFPFLPFFPRIRRSFLFISDRFVSFCYRFLLVTCFVLLYLQFVFFFIVHEINTDS